MSVLRSIEKELKRVLRRSARRKERERSTMKGAMEAIARRNDGIRTIIDVGASNGQWSASFMRHFPRARYLLVEAQSVNEDALKRFCAAHGNAEYVLAAAGGERGEIHFASGDPFGGQASSVPGAVSDIVVPMTTVDHEICTRGLSGPFLLKLDTHGFEVPILCGATKTLGSTEVIVIECYNFRISPETILFHEMCGFLGGLGFRYIDVVDLLRRPCDGLFWQMDIVFARDDRPEFAFGQYK